MSSPRITGLITGQWRQAIRQAVNGWQLTVTLKQCIPLTPAWGVQHPHLFKDVPTLTLGGVANLLGQRGFIDRSYTLGNSNRLPRLRV